MQNFEEMKFSQRVISDLSKFSPASITRFIATKKFQSLDSETHKIKRYSLTDTRIIVKSLTENNEQILRKVHVFYNFKGGTGKTSISFQVATHLAILGYNVLVIDCDPQAHLSSALHFQEDNKMSTLHDVIIGGLDIKSAIQNICEGLDAIPGNLSLTRIEVPLSQKIRREEKIAEAISAIKDRYDFIIFDTNPTISTLNMNALVAADQINVVCETQPFSLQGLGILVEELEKFFSEMQLPLNYKIIANKYESKTATAQEVLGALRSDYKDVVMQSVVRKSEDINIASKLKLPVSAFAKRSSPAYEDIIDLVTEIKNLSINSLFNTKEKSA